MRCLIVDDEEMAIKVIESHLQQLPDLEIVGRCATAMEAFGILQREVIDLLFLDIQMPRMSGLSLLRTLLPRRPHVILTTAHREFALDGFEFDVVDYLLKPIALDRLVRAVGKVYRLEDPSMNTAAPQTATETEAPAYFYIKTERRFVKIAFSEILYVESLRNHTKIVTRAENHITLVGIGEMEQRLSEEQFLRIHRSFLISLPQVQAFTPARIQIDTHELPVGAHYRAQVLHRLQQYLL